MLRRSPLLALLLTAGSLVLAGCTQGPTGVSQQEAPPVLDATWALLGVPGGEEHEHDDWAHHRNLSTPNFQVLGWSDLTTEHYGTTLTGMGCGGVGETADGRRIAVVHSINTDVAFVVADVTDPAAPQKLGEYFLPNVVVWDATVTPDGLHVLVGAYPLVFGDDGPKLPVGGDVAAPLLRVQPMWRDACTGEERAAGPEQYVPYGPGLVMVGLQDPTAPAFEQWVPQPVIGPHSVYATEIDGTTWAVSSVTNLQHEASYYDFFHVEETPLGAALVPVAHVEAPGVRPPLEFNGHVDVTLAKHPVTDQLLAYLANWDDGMRVYDLSVPHAPVEVGHWNDVGSIHNTLPLPVLWDEKHYTIVGQEVGRPEDRPSGWVYVLDTTDPANPVEVSRWTVPAEPDWADGGLQFSTHYVDVLNRTMFVTNYHGGMWAVDLADVAAPRTAGLFVPDRVPSAPFGGEAHGPNVEDVVVDPETGVLTVWDGAGGVYQLRYDEALRLPAVEEWPTAR